MIRPAESAADFATAARLITEYIDWLPFDLDFQDFRSELAELDVHYAPPRGVLLLAFRGDQAVGTAGVRPFNTEIAELKRMYVQPSGRGQRLGSRLLESAIAFAASAGYRVLRLDSDQASMPDANRLYESYGFVDIERYRPNHLECARFMELDLAVTKAK